MGRGHQHPDTRVRRFSAALGAFVRAEQAVPAAAVAEDAECLRLASELLAILADVKPVQRHRGTAGRPLVHDRSWASACLLDLALADPDGMPSQAKLIRGLLVRFEAAGKAVPGDTWLKSVVRDFQSEAKEFELDAAATFNCSPDLQAVFENLPNFLRFRRAKARAALSASTDPEIRALIPTLEEPSQAPFHKGSLHSGGGEIPAHSRLHTRRRLRSTR